MKKTVAWILALALLAVATVIGTVAYLTDVDSETNVFTIGNVDIDLLEYERIDTETANADAEVQEFHDNKPLLPAVIDKDFAYTAGDTYVDWEQIGKEAGYTSPIWDPAKINNEVDKMVFVENTGDYSAYVRIYFAFEAGNYATFERFREMIHINLNDTADEWVWEWIPFLATNNEGGKYFIAKATYQKELAPDAITEISLSQIALDPTSTNEHVSAFGDTYEVCVNTQAIQSAGFTDPDTALDEGFGRDIPFKNLKLVAGIDLKTALHNLNGDDSKPITSKVATVTFGLNETYPNIVKDNVGTFTSVEQDAMVYTYYVPNATDSTKYDLYVLADSAIYTLKDSTGLFGDMSALTTVDTTNMDVSRTENMSAMFYNCTQLTSIDVSKWNTENVTNMGWIFNKCSNLTSLDVSNWNTGNVTNMYAMFSLCSAIDGLDVSKWDVSQVTNMAYMFDRCSSITSLNVTNWDVSNVTTFREFLYNDTTNGLTSLDVSKWNPKSATDMKHMFSGCMNLESLDVSNWDVSNVTTFSSFLQSSNDQSGGMKIKEIKGIENWKTGSATVMSWMFYGCSNLTSLNLSTNLETGAWDVSKVTTMHHMFADCKSLTTLNMKGWNTENLTNMDGIFNSCESIKVLDVSDFDTQNVTDMDQVFESCVRIEQIIGLEKWDTSNVTSMCEMFFNCGQYGTNGIYGGNLQELDLSSFNTSKVINTERMFNSCDRLQTIYVGDGWDMSNVTASGGMFSACSNLKGAISYNAANANDVTYANTGTGYLTYKAAPSTNP